MKKIFYYIKKKIFLINKTTLTKISTITKERDPTTKYRNTTTNIKDKGLSG